MNRIATTPRGFPFDELSLSELQEQTVPPINALARMIPDRSIVYGCHLIPGDGAGTRADGFIIWDGELLPFVGGVNSPNFSIIEEVLERTFNIGTDADPQLEDHPAYIKRYAQIGTISGAESVFPTAALNPRPRFLTYLKKGTRYIGTVAPTISTSGTVISINFDAPVGTAAYMILCNFYRGNQSSQGSFDFDIFERRANGFKLRIKNINQAATQVYFDYLVIPNAVVNDELP